MQSARHLNYDKKKNIASSSAFVGKKSKREGFLNQLSNWHCGQLPVDFCCVIKSQFLSRLYKLAQLYFSKQIFENQLSQMSYICVSNYSILQRIMFSRLKLLPWQIKSLDNSNNQERIKKLLHNKITHDHGLIANITPRVK